MLITIAIAVMVVVPLLVGAVLVCISELCEHYEISI